MKAKTVRADGMYIHIDADGEQHLPSGQVGTVIDGRLYVPVRTSWSYTGGADSPATSTTVTLVDDEYARGHERIDARRRSAPFGVAPGAGLPSSCRLTADEAARWRRFYVGVPWGMAWHLPVPTAEQCEAYERAIRRHDKAVAARHERIGRVIRHARDKAYSDALWYGSTKAEAQAQAEDAWRKAEAAEEARDPCPVAPCHSDLRADILARV